MKNVFVYGSLMFDEVWARLLKGHYSKMHASLDGYKRVSISGEVYPGLRRLRGCKAEGILVFGLRDVDIKILDKFEGKYYTRKSVSVSVADNNHYASEVYVIRDKYKYMLSKSDWLPARFRTRHLNQFLRTYP